MQVKNVLASATFMVSAFYTGVGFVSYSQAINSVLTASFFPLCSSLPLWCVLEQGGSSIGHGQGVQVQNIHALTVPNDASPPPPNMWMLWTL